MSSEQLTCVYAQSRYEMIARLCVPAAVRDGAKMKT